MSWDTAESPGKLGHKTTALAYDCPTAYIYPLPSPWLGFSSRGHAISGMTPPPHRNLTATHTREVITIYNAPAGGRDARDMGYAEAITVYAENRGVSYTPVDTRS